MVFRAAPRDNRDSRSVILNALSCYRAVKLWFIGDQIVSIGGADMRSILRAVK